MFDILGRTKNVVSYSTQSKTKEKDTCQKIFVKIYANVSKFPDIFFHSCAFNDEVLTTYFIRLNLLKQSRIPAFRIKIYLLNEYFNQTV